MSPTHCWMLRIRLIVIPLLLLLTCFDSIASVPVTGLKVEEYSDGREPHRYLVVKTVEGHYLRVDDDLQVRTTTDRAEATKFNMTYFQGGTTALKVRKRVQVKNKRKKKWVHLSAGPNSTVVMARLVNKFGQLPELTESELWHRVTSPEGRTALQNAAGEFLSRADDGSVRTDGRAPEELVLLTVPPHTVRKPSGLSTLLAGVTTDAAAEPGDNAEALVIPAGTFGDGEVVHLQSNKDGRFLSASANGTLEASTEVPNLDATFEIVRHRDQWGDNRPAGIGETISLKTRRGTFISAASSSAAATQIGPEEKWEYLSSRSVAMFRSTASPRRFLSSDRSGAVSMSDISSHNEAWTVVVVDRGKPKSRGPEYVQFTNDRGEYLTAFQDRSLRTPGKSAGPGATFELIRHTDGEVSLKTVYGRYVMAQSEISVAAGAPRIGPTAKWQLVESGGRVSFRGSSKGWLKSEADGRVTLQGGARLSGTSWTMLVSEKPSLELVHSSDPGAGGTAPSGKIPALSLGDIITLGPLSETDSLILHRNVAQPTGDGRQAFAVGIGQPSAGTEGETAQFWVREGRSGQGVSLEAFSRPGHYLTHSGSSLRLTRGDPSKGFADSASFLLRPGWSGTKTLSLESASLSGYFVQVHEGKLGMKPVSASASEDSQLAQSASFVIASRRQQTSFSDIAARGRPAVREPGIPEGSTIQSVRLRSSQGKYLGTHKSGALFAEQDTARAWERFDLICLPDETVALRVHNGKYVNANYAHGADAMGVKIGPDEKWRIVEHADGTVSFESLKGRYLGLQPHHGWVTAEKATVTSREKWEMAEFPLNGYLVSLVVYGDGGGRVGEFSQTSPLTWKEVNRDGIFIFEETGRDEWSVYLFDAVRNVSISLDLHSKTVYFDDHQGGGRRSLYRIVDLYGTGEPARSDILTFAGVNQSVTVEGLQDELRLEGLSLVKTDYIEPNECTVLYASADDKDISAEFGMLTCAIEVDDDVSLTMVAMYGGCDASDVFSEGAGSKCEAGVFSEEFTVGLPNGDMKFGAKAPSAGYCASISSERTCVAASASLVSSSWTVADENGNGIGFSADVGVGLDFDGGYEDGVLSVGIGLKALIGGTITFSINIEQVGGMWLEGVGMMYDASVAGFVFVGEQVVTAGTAVADFFEDDVGTNVKRGFEEVGGAVESGWNAIKSIF